MIYLLIGIGIHVQRMTSTHLKRHALKSLMKLIWYPVIMMVGWSVNSYYQTVYALYPHTTFESNIARGIKPQGLADFFNFGLPF